MLSVSLRNISIRLVVILVFGLVTPVAFPVAASSSISPILNIQGEELNRYGSGEYWYTLGSFSDSVTVNSGRGGLTKTFAPGSPNKIGVTASWVR